MSVDNVANAAATPEKEQPYRDLGVKDDEYQRIRAILGRRPTSSELAMYSVMWSEHCSYKSSKVHLRQFGEKKPPTDALLVGIGERAHYVASDVSALLSATRRVIFLEEGDVAIVVPELGDAIDLEGRVEDGHLVA